MAGAHAQPLPATNHDAPTGNGTNNLLIAAVAWKQTAAEYQALYHEGYNLARMQLEKALEKTNLGHPPF